MKREEAFEILKKYNKDEFHIRHALTVEGVMRYYVDFELFSEEHCKNGGVYERENKMD